MIKYTWEELKSLALIRCVDLYRSTKPQDVRDLPEPVRTFWKIGWEISARFDDQDKQLRELFYTYPP